MSLSFCGFGIRCGIVTKKKVCEQHYITIPSNQNHLSSIKWFVVYQVVQNRKGLKGKRREKVRSAVRAVHS